MLRFRRLCLIVLLFVLLPFSALGSILEETNDVVLRRTLATISQMPGLSPQELERAGKALDGMEYNGQRVVRKLCLLPGASFIRALPVWNDLAQNPLNFEQVLAFEDWTNLSGANFPQAAEALPLLRKMNRDALKTFRACITMNGMDSALALRLLPLLKTMDRASSLAARRLFAIRGMDMRQGLDSLGTIQKFSKKQAWVCSAFAGIPDMNPATALKALPLFEKLREDDAWNMQFFIRRKKPDRNTAWTWLIRYFTQPLPVQEAQFYNMSALNRTALLDSFYHAGEEIVWKINNLHAVTNEYGIEYSQSRLQQMSSGQLQELFNRLSETTREKYGHQFATARKRGGAISVLRRATTADRTQVSEDLTSANIYALLALGSELYDSSFRDILVPILKKRIERAHQDNLLVFLRATDPANILVSNFIVSLAQKGKLTTFFPADAREQQKILHLVASSAFKDEDSILLFSATFRYLLTVLEPASRHYLIQKMVAADNGNSGFSKLITVILQYYLQEYQDLLSKQSIGIIQQTIARKGSVDLNKYLVTPFAQWKQDGQLGSLSIFHPDDDGRSSFVSNAHILVKNGYKLVLSEPYTFAANAAQQQRFSSIVAQARANRSYSTLFNAMSKEPFSAAFVKKVNGLNIRHSVHVYRDDQSQQRIMLRFLKSGDEMFAQRGHSYWRTEQLINPILKLQESKQISDQDLTSREHFLSLGSCGGVKVYTKLNRMFLGHVDILATIGTGMAMINDPYNLYFFEIIAKNPSSMTWEDMARKTDFIFSKGRGQDYLQPGCLTAILHKILDEDMLSRGLPLPSVEETDNLW
jgi:hypothetical protein